MSVEPCKQDIYENGKHVATMAGPSAELIEEYVQGIQKSTGQPVDWHYVGGRAIVKTTGDYALVEKAILSNPDRRFQFLL